jgi:hypothetical protein
MFRKYWLGIFAIVIAAITIGITLVPPDNISEIDKTIKAISIISGWVLFLVQYFYSKSEKFYIVANNIRFWLTNETTKWNFTIDFHDYKQANPIEQIHLIINRQTNKATKWHEDASSLIVNMPGYTIRAFISEVQTFDLDTERVVCVQFSDLELPYRTFRSKIDNEIVPLIKDIADTLHSNYGKYVAKISFSSTNPYFGFFVRKLELPKVVSFSCDFIDTSIGGHKQTVTVSKDRIEIVTNDILALHMLSKKYIALSGG